MKELKGQHTNQFVQNKQLCYTNLAFVYSTHTEKNFPPTWRDGGKATTNKKKHSWDIKLIILLLLVIFDNNSLMIIYLF